MFRGTGACRALGHFRELPTEVDSETAADCQMARAAESRALQNRLGDFGCRNWDDESEIFL